MGQSYLHPTPSTVGWLLLIGAAVASAPAFGQTAPSTRTTVDLAAPALKVNASVIQNNGSGVPIVVAGGMSHFVTDCVGGLPPGTDPAMLRLRQYQKLACLADAIALGRVGRRACHLSAFRSAVYCDYDFLIDALLKDNRMSSIESKPHIVVTRPGGVLELPDGGLRFEFDAFPGFEPRVTYLLFLRHIPASSSYEAIDADSALSAAGDNWVFVRRAFSGQTFPEFTRGVLEASIHDWLTSCN